jgi:glutamine amidotransferase-like uncharacterized protein
MRIAIFHHYPYASADCCLALWQVLCQEHSIEIIGVRDVTARRLRKFDMVAFPGGMGDANRWSTLFDDAYEMQRYISGGGKYLGICMGAYWAVNFGLLPNTSVSRYIECGEIHRSYATVANVIWRGIPERMYFWDGPVFDKAEEVIATYANGMPMAIREGNAVLIGCHPESQLDWFSQPYLRSSWHYGSHHRLLLDLLA